MINYMNDINKDTVEEFMEKQSEVKSGNYDI